ncbi:VirE protein [Mediterranea massiliensis]|uniref:VirE protein n=1 Tax=Mediterranea massiliensis TaxID=1841865 RepID=UPI0023F2BD3C|nr:VirE protein [Mediterranea massiliensis]
MNIFTCIGRGHGAPALPATRQEWEAMRREPWLAEMCRRIEAGDEKLKRRLPIWTPHCAAFRDNHRAAADALKPLPRLMLDFDEKGHSAEILERSLALQKESKWQVLLVEESVRRGTHVLIVLPDGMTPQEAQKRFSADVGFQADGALKDVSRCIYMVPEDHTLYVDEERLFGNEELRMKNEELPPANPSVGTHHGASDDASDANDDAANAPHTDDAANAPKADAPWCVPTFKGIPYSEIIQQWFRLAGGEPVQGERNDKLHRLASHLRYIADNDEALLLQVMPRYGLSEEEMRGLIHSACSAKWYSMPKMMREALENEERRMKNEESLKNEERRMKNGESTEDGENSSFGGEADILHSSLPKRLPALIKLLVSRTPDVYKAAVAHAVFPALGAHLHRVRFRYIDNVEHEATLMNVLMAGTGAGKDCISEPINRIMADIRRRDEDNLRREREWKNEVTSKGANKDKRQRPEGLIIQEIDADMTNPAFVMRMAEADGHFLYTKLNEIDQFDALRGSGRGGQQFQIMCLAFDPGNRYGQTRVGVQSVTEKVTVRFNWNASTTIQKGRRYFSKVLTDGPISRINFCTIPEREIGADMPVYGTYDAAFDEELRPYIENLVKAQGLIDCPQAYKLAQKLKEECADFARLSQSRVYENLSFRANVIAYLKACVLYVANGCQWDKTFEDFIRWSLQYDLACKMEFFGADIDEAQTVSLRSHKGPRNLLELLPDEFTFREVVQTRLREGKNEEGTYKMLRQWIHRGYIQQLTVDSYQKLKFRKDGTYIDKN